MYEKTKVRVATYMAKTSSVWISEAWKRECRSEYCSIEREAEDSLKELGINMQLYKDKVVLDGKEMTIVEGMLENSKGEDKNWN